MANRKKSESAPEDAGNPQALARAADGPAGEILLYRTEDGHTRVECRFADESLWMSQALMAELFQTTPQNVTQHLKALYEEGEIAEAATCKNYLQVRTEGVRKVRRQVKHYNLDAILAGDEIGELNRIVVMWLDYAEDQARRRKQVFLQDWRTKLDDFLRFNERNVLGGAGKVSHQEAVERAEEEYEQFAARRRALLEAQGEHDGVAALEAAARLLNEPPVQAPRAPRKKR